MKHVEYHRWYLPNRNPRGKPYLSAWPMDEAEARSRGALRPELTTRELREVPETPEEAEALRRRSDTSRLGGGSREPR